MAADASTMRLALTDRYRSIFDRAQQLMVQALQDAAPLGQTGETRRGIHGEPDASADDHFAGRIVSDSKHGDYVEEGTAAHIIVPVAARALRFQAGGRRISQPGPNQRIATRAGGVQFAKIVHHPDTPARPWFRPVLDQWSVFLDQAAASA